MAMHRKEAFSLIEFISKINPSGTCTANYIALNPWSTFVVKKTTYKTEDVKSWNVPGLFVADADLNPIKPYTNIVYVMASDEVLLLCLPSLPLTHYRPHVPVLKRGIFGGQSGFWVALENWHKVASTADLVLKCGTKKKTHHARRATV
jgi:hypothetical protein